MKTLNEISEYYKTDKRILEHNYVQFYEKYFQNLRNEKLKILEIGIYRPQFHMHDGRHDGASLKTWRDYFPNAEIFGADIMDFKDVEDGRIKTIVCDQGFRRNEESKHGGLENIIHEFGGDFDIIIDDGGHTIQQQLVTLGYLFPYLKSGGIFVIEDLHTSYIHPHIYNSTFTENTTLKFLNNIKNSGKVTSEFLTKEELKYTLNNIKNCLVEKANISEIAFIFKK